MFIARNDRNRFNINNQVSINITSLRDLRNLAQNNKKFESCYAEERRDHAEP